MLAHNILVLAFSVLRWNTSYPDYRVSHFRLDGLPAILPGAGAIESDGDGIGAAVTFVQRCERA